jgi:alpha-N-arabinofuranosidase
MLRHAERVQIGCLAQLVNVIAPIRTEPGGPAWRQTTFHPFALTSRFGRGMVIRTEEQSPTINTSWFGDVPALDSAATLDESGAVSLFVVNREQDEPLALAIDVRAQPDLTVAQHTALYDDDPDAVNSAEQPDRVTPRRLDDARIENGRVEAVLPPASWSMLRLLPDSGGT